MFKIGDRVQSRVNHPGGNQHIFIGSTGTVVYEDSCGTYGVEFDDYIDGHSSGGEGKYGHCWFMGSDFLEPESPQDNAPFDFDDGEFLNMIGGE